MHSWKEHDPIDLTDDGISNFIKDKHPSKALDPIDVTDDGISNSNKDEHLLKEFDSIDLTDKFLLIILKKLQKITIFIDKS